MIRKVDVIDTVLRDIDSKYKLHIFIVYVIHILAIEYKSSNTW